MLGASSGFGEANSLALARAGANVLGVHLDRRVTQPNAERIRDEITAMGREARFFNINAADADKRRETLDAVAEEIGPAACASCCTRSPSARSSGSWVTT